MSVRTHSAWEETLTFFPQFCTKLIKGSEKKVLIVGASDGKFVLPFARQGVHVTAVECNSLALNGGQVTFPDGVGHLDGLKSRLKQEKCEENVTIIEKSFLDDDLILSPTYDAVWTSCSWHYSMNAGRHREFILKMITTLAPGGIFGAEYMMPLREGGKSLTPRYLREGDINGILTQEGLIVELEVFTTEFTEAPHVEQLEPHTHRMGFVIAYRQ